MYPTPLTQKTFFFATFTTAIKFKGQLQKVSLYFYYLCVVYFDQRLGAHFQRFLYKKPKKAINLQQILAKKQVF